MGDLSCHPLPCTAGFTHGHTLKLSKDVSNRSKAENKGKYEKEMPSDCAAKCKTALCFESPYLQVQLKD